MCGINTWHLFLLSACTAVRLEHTHSYCWATPPITHFQKSSPWSLSLYFPYPLHSAPGEVYKFEFISIEPRQHSSFSMIYLTLCNVDLLSVLYHVPAFSPRLKTISLLYPSLDGFLVFLSCFMNGDTAVCIGGEKPQVPAFNFWVYTLKQNC